MKRTTRLAIPACLIAALLASAVDLAGQAAKKPTPSDPTEDARAAIGEMEVRQGDWPMFFGWPHRNNTPAGKNIPHIWNIDTGMNIKWKARLGSQTYGNPVVANGKVYVGTNNGAGYIKRYPSTVDLGCLICLDEKTGKFLWQHSNEKLKTGRVHDWPEQGICCAPYVDGERLWYVSSRGEVVCLDTQGFYDGENDGPHKAEPVKGKLEADVVWKFDMMGKLGVSQHNMCSCSPVCAGDVLLINTSNGLDQSHINLPAPDAPTFIALDRMTGKLLWTDKSPGTNILHGQWSSPTYAVLGGQPQAIFAAGDGWVYSFAPKGDGKGGPKLLWKFDCNPKDSKWIVGGIGTRNNIIATPVVYDKKLYVAVGQDPEHGEGMGHLWCIDPAKKLDGSDVSPTIAVDAAGKPLPMPRPRLQAIDPTRGEKDKKNPNSAALWHYGHLTREAYDKAEYLDQMHRSCGTVAIKNDLLYIADFSGLFLCLNAQTGKKYWAYDMFSAAWGSPLIVEDKVYIGDEDGDVAIFPLTGNPKVAIKMLGGDPKPALGEVNMGNSVFSTPIVANNVLYIANKNTLFAITPGGK